MKNLINLIIKASMTWLILTVLISVFGRSTWTQTLLTGVVLVALNYVAVDLWVLPKFGNLVAIVTEFIILMVALWGMVRALPQFVITSGGYWVISLALVVGEWFFHQYLLATKASLK